MKAIRLHETGGIDKLKLEEIDVPRPGSNEVLVKVAACGVCWHDIVVRNGTMRRGFKPGMQLGHEVSGTVVELGPDVETVSVGDRVAAKHNRVCGRCKNCRAGLETKCQRSHLHEAGYAEYQVFDEWSLVKVPAEVSLEQASIVSCGIGVSYHGVRDEGAVRPGETVLVTGAGGGLGIHAVQAAKVCGARVIAQTTSEDKVAKLKEYGADEVVLTRDANFHEQVRKLTDGEGVNVVADTVGSIVFTSAFRSLAQMGRYVFMGQLTGDSVAFNPAFMFFTGARFIGSSGSTRQNMVDILTLVKQGKIRPVLSATYPLEEAGTVHRLMEERKIFGRAALIP